MRVEGWRAKEIFGNVEDGAVKAVNGVMDDVADRARMMCPIGTITRTGEFVKASVSFTPKTGANKGTLVSFTAQRWMGRTPGDLMRTIRRVNKPTKPGNVRVYAGSQKIYYAFMVEYGTVKTKAQPFLRPAFETVKQDIISNIEDRMKATPEIFE